MKLLADESVDFPIIRRLRAENFAVDSIAETNSGVPDDQVLSIANANGALLLTADKDFGELVFRLGRIHNGVVLLRLEGLAAAEKAELVSEVLVTHANEFPGSFTVISQSNVRIRRGS